MRHRRWKPLRSVLKGDCFKSLKAQEATNSIKMKKASRFLIAIACLTVAGSCSVQDIDIPSEDYSEGAEMTFTASFGEVETKSALQSNQSSIWWSRNDDICIYYGMSAGNRFVATNDEDEFYYAYFTGQLTAFTGQDEHGNPNYFWAVYPHDSAVNCDGSSVTVTLPSQQTAKAGSFANKTNLSIAKSSGLNLAFYNACAWFRFSVTKQGVKSVVFRGNNNEDVAGCFNISMDETGKPTDPTIVTGEKEIILTAPEGESLEVGQLYYITLLPGTFEHGFTATFYTDNEIGSRSIDRSTTFVRRLYNTGLDFDKDVVYVENSVIRYTSTDGEAVWPYDEFAFDAPILSNKYIDGQGTITFFGELTNVGFEAFRTCRTLKTISFPETVTSIGGWSFFRCSSLESVTFPQNLTSIDECAFFGTDLRTVSIPASVENIAFRVFSYCSNLNSISVASDNHSYDSRDYSNAIIDTDDDAIIAGCKNSRFPDEIKEISRYAFMGITGLTSITIPTSVDYIGENAFFDCTGLTTATFLNETPPDGGPGVFNQCYSLQTIKVPSGQAVKDYKKKSPWKDYSGIIMR